MRDTISISAQYWAVHFVIFVDLFLEWKKTHLMVVHYLAVETNGIKPSFNFS